MTSLIGGPERKAFLEMERRIRWLRSRSRNGNGRNEQATWSTYRDPRRTTPTGTTNVSSVMKDAQEVGK